MSQSSAMMQTNPMSMWRVPVRVVRVRVCGDGSRETGGSRARARRRGGAGAGGKWRRCCFHYSGGSLGGAAAFWPAKVALSTIWCLRVAVLPHWQWHCRPSSSQAHNCHVLEPGEGFGWGCVRGMHNDRGSPNLTLRLAIEQGINCGRNRSVRM